MTETTEQTVDAQGNSNAQENSHGVLSCALPRLTNVLEVECPGDGACAFHAVAFSLSQLNVQGLPSILSGQELRHLLADYIAQHPDLTISGDHFAHFIANEGEIDLSLLGEDVSGGYAERIRQGLWAGQLEVNYLLMTYITSTLTISFS